MHVITIIRRGIRDLLKPVFNSFLRTLGKFLAWFLLLLVLVMIFSKKVNAQTYTSIDSPMNTNYLETFRGHTSTLLHLNDKYVAFSYSCSYWQGSYERWTTCYYYCYGSELTKTSNTISGKCNYFNFYVNGSSTLILDKGVDNDFNVTGNMLYSSFDDDLHLSKSWEMSLYEKCIILAICFIFGTYIIKSISYIRKC